MSSTPFDTTNTWMVGQRSIDFHSFARNALLISMKMLKGTHIVQTVGQFKSKITRISLDMAISILAGFLLLNCLMGLVTTLPSLVTPSNDIPYICTKNPLPNHQFFGVFTHYRVRNHRLLSLHQDGDLARYLPLEG